MRSLQPVDARAYWAAAISVVCFACVPVVIKDAASLSNPFLFNAAAMATQAVSLTVFLAVVSCAAPPEGRWSVARVWWSAAEWRCLWRGWLCRVWSTRSSRGPRCSSTRQSRPLCSGSGRS